MRDLLMNAVQWSHRRATALNRENNELEQAIIRIVITAIVGVYSLGYVRQAMPDSPLHNDVWVIFGIYAVFAALSLGWVLFSPAASIVRRVTAMIADIAILSYAMGISGAHGAAWYPAYLWVTFGNGFRYGTAYLHTASALSVAGFATVVFYSPFWTRYLELSIGLMIGLIVLPMYVSRLLRRLETAIRSADEARNEAELANQEKSRFLANMSHELRTPLNGVIATSDVLGTMRLDSDARELVNTIQSSAQTLLGLIDEILDIGKIESGRMEIEDTSFHLRTVLINIHEMMLPLARRKNIALTLYCDTAIPDNLIGDPGHLKQVILNIVGNAIKFTEKGAVTVRVELEGDDGESVRTRITIADSGIGIPDDAKERIFDAFTQASSSITRTHGGTGLGVTIARELTELMGGSISLESQVGIGTTFQLTIPFRRNPDHVDVFIAHRTLVLLIGPDSPALDGIGRMLRELGLPAHTIKRVTSLHDIRGHIEKYPELSPVIMFDANINNFESILKAQGGTRHISSIAFNVTPELKEYVIRAGVSAALDAGSPDIKTVERALECCVYLYETPLSVTGEIDANDDAPLRVLAADDNKTNRDILQLALARAGHQVDLAADGDQALALLGEREYDVVILDMNMGETSGLSVIQEYRMLSPTSTLPFILLTADATHEARATAEEYGFARYITKPFRTETLLGAVSSVVAPSRETPAAASGLNDGDRAPSPAQWLDENTIASLRMLAGNDAGFLEKLYRDYVMDAESLITRMEVALIGHQYEECLDLAHALKGSSGHIGARAVYERCAQLSDTSVADIEAHGPDLLKRISEAVRQTNGPLFTALCGGEELDQQGHG